MLAALAWGATHVPVAAQETVTITVPAAVSFAVTDVSQSTAGVPSPVRVSFLSGMLSTGKALRVSVQADTSTFAPPGGAGIPASRVSWTMLGANGGVGSNGTLSASSYGLVFQSNPRTLPDVLGLSGYVDLRWTLAAPGTGILAGTHALTVRWKLESITP